MIRTFKQFLEEGEYTNNPVPLGRYNQDEMNIDHLVHKVDNNTPRIITINPNSSVSVGKLFATQSWLSVIGGGDPVNPKYEKYPIIVNYKGIWYIVDGHHRIAKAYNQKRNIRVYFFP